MALTSIHQFIREHPTIRSSRFPGWLLHLSVDVISGELTLYAKRESDGRKLEYSEYMPPYKMGYQDVIDRLSDRLAGDFLDLVPLQELEMTEVYARSQRGKPWPE